jgi:hypothetical protein
MPSFPPSKGVFDNFFFLGKVSEISIKHYQQQNQVDHSTSQYRGRFCLPCKLVHFSSLYVQVQQRKVPSKYKYPGSLITLQVWALNQIGRIIRNQLLHMNRLEDLTPSPSMPVPIEHSSRPTLGFPLGTALLLLVIFSLSGIFSCCYHWDKLRSLLWSRHPDMFQEGQHTVISIASSPDKTTSDPKVVASSYA